MLKAGRKDNMCFFHKVGRQAGGVDKLVAGANIEPTSGSNNSDNHTTTTKV